MDLGMPITDETAPEIIAEVVGVLRDAGKAELADRYKAAIERAMAAIGHHQTLIERRANQPSLMSARDSQDDAVEDLQRVDAEVDAFFEDRLKGDE